MPSTARTFRSIFVTVGTTRFDKLIEAVTTKEALAWMTDNGYRRLTIQYGTGKAPQIPDASTPDSMTIQSYDFQPTLEADMKEADLILSHAGAGTVMEALRHSKNLAVVINTMLMDNHQLELATAMAERGHLFVVENPDILLGTSSLKTWESLQTFVPIPYSGGDELDFSRLLDVQMGFGKDD